MRTRESIGRARARARAWACAGGVAAVLSAACSSSSSGGGDGQPGTSTGASSEESHASSTSTHGRTSSTHEARSSTSSSPPAVDAGPSVPCTGKGGGGLEGLTFSACAISGMDTTFGPKGSSRLDILPAPGAYSTQKFSVVASGIAASGVLTKTTYTPKNSAGQFLFNAIDGANITSYGAQAGEAPDPMAVSGDYSLTLTGVPDGGAFTDDGAEHGSLHLSLVNVGSDAGGTATLDITF